MYKRSHLIQFFVERGAGAACGVRRRAGRKVVVITARVRSEHFAETYYKSPLRQLPKRFARSLTSNCKVRPSEGSTRRLRAAPARALHFEIILTTKLRYQGRHRSIRVLFEYPVYIVNIYECVVPWVVWWCGVLQQTRSLDLCILID